jgi:hypothetical protein
LATSLSPQVYLFASSNVGDFIAELGFKPVVHEQVWLFRALQYPDP